MPRVDAIPDRLLKLPRKTDERVVASAVAGGADVLVTGDAVVLKLGKRAPLPSSKVRFSTLATYVVDSHNPMTPPAQVACARVAVVDRIAPVATPT